MLVVFKDGNLVLDAGWQHMADSRNDLHETYPNVWSRAGENARLRKGEWFNVDQGQAITLDVGIGDWGGLCGYFLCLEKEGATYETLPDGTPKLPLFQLGAKLKQPSGGDSPSTSDSDSVWIPADNN